MIARKMKLALGVGLAVLGMAAFSPDEAQAGGRGRSFGFYFNSGRDCGPRYYRPSYHSRSYYGGYGGYHSYGYRSSCGPRYYSRSYYAPRYYSRSHCAPRYYSRGHCGW